MKDLTHKRPLEMTGYTKLFGTIVASTIWREDKETKIVWITMLAMANKLGIVEASIPGLADMARVTIPEVERALECLEGPDRYSRTKDHEGRRIRAVDGGWLVLNHAKYRAKMNADERREYFRVAKQEQRERDASKSVNKCQRQSKTVKDKSTASTQSEAQSQSDAKAESFQPPTPVAVAPTSGAFDEFWKAYPKKAGKGDALKAWKKLKCDSVLPEILTGIRLAMESEDWTKEGGKYRPNPATWLNRTGWEDDPSTWTTGKRANGNTVGLEPHEMPQVYIPKLREL
jgi:hypothetical protein